MTRVITAPTKVEPFVGDPPKVKHKLGWVPEITLDQMVIEKAAYDLAEEKNWLLRQCGYVVGMGIE